MSTGPVVRAKRRMVRSPAIDCAIATLLLAAAALAMLPAMGAIALFALIAATYRGLSRRRS